MRVEMIFSTRLDWLVAAASRHTAAFPSESCPVTMRRSFMSSSPPDARFLEEADRAGMMRQARLQLAGVVGIEQIERRMAFAERLAVGMHRSYEFVHRFVGHVRADADDEIERLHPGRLVDAHDVRRRLQLDHVILRA